MPRRYKHRRKVGRLCQRFRAHVFSARGAVVIGARPSTARGRRVRADHSVRPEWSLQGPCSDHWGPASHVLHSLRALIRSAREAASRVPPRGGAAEVRHCPVPVRCSGWGSVPGSAAPGPCVTPWLHVRRDQSWAPIGTGIAPAHASYARACFLWTRAATRAGTARQPRPCALRGTSRARASTAVTAQPLHRLPPGMLMRI